ncbi:hypothetical protein BTH41_01057 [Bacillus mycoides]|nr:hypothetical protein BTH41_01057 [Bacillus mycoides]
MSYTLRVYQSIFYCGYLFVLFVVSWIFVFVYEGSYESAMGYFPKSKEVIYE